MLLKRILSVDKNRCLWLDVYLHIGLKHEHFDFYGANFGFISNEKSHYKQMNENRWIEVHLFVLIGKQRYSGYL